MREYQISLLSSIPGVVTARDALLQVRPALPDAVTVHLNGVSHDARALSTPEQSRVLVRGLQTGENTVEISTNDGTGSISFRATAPEGTAFSGPRPSPWRQTTAQAGWGDPIDEFGSVLPSFRFVYMNAVTAEFDAYNLSNPPAKSQVATVTTDAGQTVPYIVRIESGTTGLGLYELAVLCLPDLDWSSIHPQRGWNGKLWVYLYGGWAQQWSQGILAADAAPPAPAQTILIDSGLRRGYMIARTTQAQSATNSDSIRGAESLVQLKDHVTANYGPIRFTLGSGASGGSIMQHMIANQYPGIFQGIIPHSSLHGSWYVSEVVAQSRLLHRYFTETSPDLWTTEEERTAVDGHRGDVVRDFFHNVFDHESPRLVGGNDPFIGTTLPKEAVYSTRNPGGVRGGLAEYQVNYLGRRPEESWTPAERAAGHGFAYRPWENRGIQYGLGALRKGRITAEQFVDLNEKIGGLDLDNLFTSERTTADEKGIERAHRSGLVNDFLHLATVAIIDVRPPEVEDLPSHTQFHTWIVRAGLEAAVGGSDNHVAWMIPGWNSFTVPPTSAFEAMDEWLTAVEADESVRPLASKVTSARPAHLEDGVYAIDGSRLGDLTDYLSKFPPFGDARLVAADGDLNAFRIAKPQLKPLSRLDYVGIAFPTSSGHAWRRPSVRE